MEKFMQGDLRVIVFPLDITANISKLLANKKETIPKIIDVFAFLVIKILFSFIIHRYLFYVICLII